MRTDRKASRLLPAVAAAALVTAAPGLARAGCSVSPVADLDGNGSSDLKLVGDGNRQVLVLIDKGTEVVVSLDCDNDGRFTGPQDQNAVPYPGIESIYVDLHGVDLITYSPGAALAGVARQLVLMLGANGNTVNIVNPGNFDLTGNTSLAVDILGGLNLDVLNIDLGAGRLDNSALLVYGDMGTGSDSLNVKLPQASAGLVDIDVALNQGNNTASVGSGGRSSASTFRVNVEGGDVDPNTDKISTRFGGVFDNASRLQFRSELGSSEDVFDGGVDVSTFQLLNGSQAFVSVAGGPGRDFVSVADAGVPGAAVDDGLIELSLRGGVSADVLSLDWNGLTGGGVFRYRAHGGLQSDTVVASLLTGSASRNDLDIVLGGGRSPDTLYGAIYDPGSATYGPAGTAFVDGGADVDRQCVTFGDGTLNVISCEMPL